MNVIQTITAVKRDLGAVAKGNRMEAGPAKYNYRSIDDVLNGLHDGLIAHGLVFAPVAKRIQQVEAGKTSSGTVKMRTILEMDYLIHGPEGDSIAASTVGEAIDSGDKGVNKASTAAFKVLLTQLLAIPFETDDPDHAHTVTGDESTKPVAKASAKPAAKPEPKAEGGRTCPTCTYAIGPKDTVKKGPDRKFHHTQCLTEAAPAAKTEALDPNDIASIIGD